MRITMKTKEEIQLTRGGRGGGKERKSAPLWRHLKYARPQLMVSMMIELTVSNALLDITMARLHLIVALLHLLL